MRGLTLSAGRFHTLWERHKTKAFPAGAITFPLRLWSRGILDSEGAAEARRVCREHGLEKLVVVHGSALEHDRGATILCGPPGIGKTTVTLTVIAQDGPRLIEDGVALLGVSGGRWSLVETGTLEVLRRNGRIAKAVRRALGLDTSVYFEVDGDRRKVRLWIFRHLIERPSFALAVALSKAGPPHRPRLVPLAFGVLAVHPKRPALGHTVDALGRVTGVADLVEILPSSVRRAVLSTLGERGEVRARLTAALRASVGGAPGSQETTVDG